MRRTASRLRWGVGLGILLGCSPTTDATTIQVLTFSEICRQAAVVIEGTVVDIDVESTSQPSRPGNHTPQLTPPAGSSGLPGVPVELPTEGGRMLFSLVTVQVENVLAGTVESTLTLKLAGGATDEGVVTVHGMPHFQIGKRYVLFLREGFENVADPIVGVNQGFLEITTDPKEGSEMILNMSGDILVGVDEDRFIVRVNPARDARRTPQLGAPPVPDSPDQLPSRISPEVSRYWLSEEPPMTLRQLADSVLMARGEL